MRIASLSDGRKVYIRRTDEPVRMHQKLHPAVRPMALEVPALGVSPRTLHARQRYSGLPYGQIRPTGLVALQKRKRATNYWLASGHLTTFIAYFNTHTLPTVCKIKGFGAISWSQFIVFPAQSVSNLQDS
jgi:hypothetical protein